MVAVVLENHTDGLFEYNYRYHATVKGSVVISALLYISLFKGDRYIEA
jgi:hypothetical protein